MKRILGNLDRMPNDAPQQLDAFASRGYCGLSPNEHRARTISHEISGSLVRMHATEDTRWVKQSKPTHAYGEREIF